MHNIGSSPRLISATTTLGPENIGSIVRLQSDAPKYNETAIRVMKKHKVAINDFILRNQKSGKKEEKLIFLPLLY